MNGVIIPLNPLSIHKSVWSYPIYNCELMIVVLLQKSSSLLRGLAIAHSLNVSTPCQLSALCFGSLARLPAISSLLIKVAKTVTIFPAMRLRDIWCCWCVRAAAGISAASYKGEHTEPEMCQIWTW